MKKQKTLKNHFFARNLPKTPWSATVTVTTTHKTQLTHFTACHYSRVAAGQRAGCLEVFGEEHSAFGFVEVIVLDERGSAKPSLIDKTIVRVSASLYIGDERNKSRFYIFDVFSFFGNKCCFLCF